MSLSGTEYLVTSFARSTTSTSALITGDGIAVLILLAPKFHLFFLGALDAPLAHLLVVLYLCFRELAVLPEDDVEAKAEYAERYKHQSCKKYLHPINQ